MRTKRFSAIVAITMVFMLMFSSIASAATVISNTLEATFTVTSAPKVSTMVLDSPTDFGLLSDSDNAAIGEGSWRANGNVLELYITPSQITENPIKINDIDYVAYQTNKSGEQGDVDFFFTIYTEKYEGDLGKWYGNRLTAEPMYSNNLAAPANQWNTWNTKNGNNQLTFFDGDYGPMGFYGAPTLAAIQNGEIAWDNGKVDYRNQTVKYFKVGTGSAWAADFTDAYLDEIIIALKDGTSVTFDLEPGEVQVNPAIEAVNSATDVDSMINVLATEDLSSLGITEESINKYNEMPAGEGRQQAVAGAVIASKPASGYTTAAEIKEVFEYFVDQEYHKYLFINAVDGAQTIAEMKTALVDTVPTLYIDRQDLITNLVNNGYDDTAAELIELKNSNYTLSLDQVDTLISSGANDILDIIARELLIKRNELPNSKFFGVVPATDAITDILTNMPVENNAELDSVLANDSIGGIILKTGYEFAGFAVARDVAIYGDTVVGVDVTSGIKISAPNVTLAGLNITPSVMNGVDPGTIGVAIDNAQDVVIKDCTIATGDKGVVFTISGQSDAYIENVNFKDLTKGIVLNGQTLEAVDNNFDGVNYGICSTENANLGTITRNSFINGTEAIGLGDGVTSSTGETDLVKYLEDNNTGFVVVDYRTPSQLINLVWDGNDPSGEYSTGDEVSIGIIADLAVGVETVDNVRYEFEVTKDSSISAGDFEIISVDGSADTQGINDTFRLDGSVLRGYWGPVEGFTFNSDMNNTTTNMTVRFNNAGTYTVKVYAVKVQ